MDNGLASSGDVASVADMATPRDLPRQVNQNKNDIEALYKLSKKTNDKVKVIAKVQKEHGQRLDTMDGRLGSIEATQGEHSGKLDEILGILKAS